jgi:hypothetical protein
MPGRFKSAAWAPIRDRRREFAIMSVLVRPEGAKSVFFAASAERIEIGT